MTMEKKEAKHSYRILIIGFGEERILAIEAQTIKP